ncbi:MAG: hypothetical protein SynsKO_02190 [Synoicihabitans sp.]
MKNIDHKISEALRESYPEVDIGPEPNLAEELITAFRGRNRWTHALAFVFSLIALGVFIWAAIRFYDAPNVREQLNWGGVAFFATIFISFQKVWFWMEMHSNRVLREIKRIELLLCSQKK